MRSFLDADIYEKNFAYFRLFNIIDLPENQLYLYGPGDDVSQPGEVGKTADNK